MKNTEHIIDWREGIENIFQMHGPYTAKEAIYKTGEAIQDALRDITMATVHYRTGDISEAHKLIEPYSYLVEHLEERFQKDYALIQCAFFLATHQFVAARECLEIATRNFPEDVTFFILKSRVNVLTGTQSLEQAYQEIVQDLGERYEILLAFGDYFFQDYHNEIAKKLLQKALEMDPNSVKALNVLGYIELEAMDDQRSFDYFLKSFELWPYQLSLIYSLIDVSLLLNQLEVAKKIYTKALSIFPLDEKLNVDYAVLLLQSYHENIQEVVVHCSEIVDRFPDDYRSYLLAANAFCLVQDWSKAMTLIKKSIQLNSSSDALLLEAKIAQQLGV